MLLSLVSHRDNNDWLIALNEPTQYIFIKLIVVVGVYLQTSTINAMIACKEHDTSRAAMI